MPSKPLLSLLASLLCLPPAEAATSLHRCEAIDGSVTFTSMSCANGEQRSVQEVHPYSPGSVVAVMPEHNHEEMTGMKTKGREPGVIGIADDPCGNLIDARQRRAAIINQRVIAGMTQQDVESALGKPDKVTGGAASELSGAGACLGIAVTVGRTARSNGPSRHNNTL